MIRILWDKKWIPFERIEWSGTDNQCSRKIVFTVPSNPYDKHFENPKLKLGDVVCMYDGKTRIFVGTVTARERTAEVGKATYTALDFMHHLLRSNGSYKFKGKSPEKITTQVCRELGIGTASLAKSGITIQKLFFDDKCIYDIIVRAYRKAYAKNGKKYMPVMDGKKVSVIEKGKPSGVSLDQSVDITSASYKDTTDNMVNIVKIYDDSLKQVGKVEKKKHVDKYGVYQSTYKKEKGVNAKAEAKAMLVGITKEASVEAVGDIRAISGTSLEIYDSAAGLKGTFYITSDTHTFENGVHMMSLGLSWSNEMAEGADSELESGSRKKDGTSGRAAKAELLDKSKCYYIEGASVYHSTKSCSACKGKNTKESTVAAIKKVKIQSGKNKGKRKYKPCSRCWVT